MKSKLLNQSQSPLERLTISRSPRIRTPALIQMMSPNRNQRNLIPLSIRKPSKRRTMKLRLKSRKLRFKRCIRRPRRKEP
jgi:hypothetical protein